MPELPSVANLIVSTVVFFIAIRYLHRHCDAQDLPSGLARTVLLMVLASSVSWASGYAADWVQEQFATPQSVSLSPLPPL